MNAVAPLCFTVPIVAACVAALTSPLPRRGPAVAVALSATVAVAGLCAVLLGHAASGRVVVWLGGWEPRGGVALGIDLAIDRFGSGLALFAGVLAIVAALLAARLVVAAPPLFYAALLLFAGAMVAFCLTGDLFNLFVFFELMSVAAYVLVGYEVRQRAPLEGALTFAVTNTTGSILLLFGIGLAYGETGALNLAQIGRALAMHGPSATVAVAFGLIAVGLLVKAAVVPFHLWVADAYAVAPTPVCIMLAGVFSELGLYGLARVWWVAFAPALGGGTGALRATLVAVGLLTGLVGGALALAQHHLKRMLAYVVVSQIGTAMVGIGLLDGAGLAGAAVFIVGDGLVKAALFVAVAVVQHRYDRIDTRALHGRARELRVVAGAYLLAALAIAGLPPFGSFLGRAMIEDAALARPGYAWVPAVLAVICALAAAALLRAWARVFLGWGRRAPHDAMGEVRADEEGSADEASGAPRAASPWLWGPSVALVAGALAWGVVPGLRHAAAVGAAAFVHTDAYAQAVLGTGRAGPIELPEVPAPGATALLYAAASVAGALAIATAGLLRSLPEGPAGAVDRVRALHSGRPGDYVTWAVVGAVVLTTVFVLTLG
jgi:multicomponent Na+:H+ antiporter subunit D